MPSAKANNNFVFPGYAFDANEAEVSYDSLSAYEITLAAVPSANSGTLDERTDDNTGFANLGAAHTIANSATVDVYWAAGVRYGMTASTSGGDISLEGGAGDVLPALSTAITVVTQTAINPLNLDGDNAKMIAVVYRNASDTSAKAHVDFQDSGSVTIREVDLVHETAYGGLDEVLNISGGDTNTYTGNPVTKGTTSHDSTSAATLFIVAGIDATP